MSSKQYVPLIIDIGYLHIAAGVAGDYKPSVVVATSYPDENRRSVEQAPPFFEINDLALNKHEKDELYCKLRENKHYNALIELYNAEQHNWLDMNDQVKLQIKLDEVFTELVLNPKSCKVVVIDRNFPAIIKIKILNVLINKIGVKSLIFQPEPILSLIGGHIDNGIVVNIDWDCTTIHAIVDLREVAVKELPKRYTGMGMHYLIAYKLIQSESRLVKNKDDFHLIQEAISQINLTDYKLPQYANEINSLDVVHDVVSELYFQESTIIESIESLVTLAHIDSRKLLLENVIFTGEVSKIAGFKLKLLDLIKKRLNVEGTFTLGCWSGCSLYISTKLIHDNARWKEMQYTKDSLLQYITSNGFKLASII